MQDPIKSPKPEIDFDSIWQEWKLNTRLKVVYELADKLETDYFILDYIGCAWSVYHFAWAFRMFKDEKVVGIRLINGMGHKWVHQYSEDGSIINGIPKINEEIEKIVKLLDYKK